MLRIHLDCRWIVEKLKSFLLHKTVVTTEGSSNMKMSFVKKQKGTFLFS